MNKILLKNILAVVVGYVLIFVLSVGTDILLSILGIFPSLNGLESYANWMYALSLAYTCVYIVVGGYVTARLSATNPLRQVYILAILGFVLNTTITYMNWAQAVGHEWYCILAIIVNPVFVYIGGRIFLRK